MTNEVVEDPELVEALDRLWTAIESAKGAKAIVPALEDLIDLKIAMAIEAMADRMETAAPAPATSRVRSMLDNSNTIMTPGLSSKPR